MRFVLASDDFVYAKRSRPGFPLILNADMEPSWPEHSYLMSRLLEKGVALDIKTWDSYGRAIWDFTRFLEANDLTWDQPFTAPGNGVVVMYRDWQVELKLDPVTINGRLRLVVAMYEWALDQQLIRNVPFEYKYVTRRAVESALAHKTGGEQTTAQPTILTDEWDKEPAFLTSEQLVVARQEIRAGSQRLLFDLMARVGLRSVEARTFPLKYVFDPQTRRDLRPGSMIHTSLNPMDMEIKLDKPRVVAIPYGLMEDMWAYSQFERNRLAGTKQRVELILTVNGNRYSNSSAQKVFAYLGKRIGFKVTPLMLRHSYAIHTLLVLRSHPELELEPLLWLRDRMGHKSVTTTMIYLRQIERLMGGEAEKMMSEFDAIYGVTSALSMSSSLDIETSPKS
jgi:integrase/recombinase XerD